MIAKKKVIYQIQQNIQDVITHTTPLGKDLWELLLQLHPADIALIISRIEEEQQDLLFKKLPASVAPDVFEKLSSSTQAQIVTSLPSNKSAVLLQQAPVDVLTDIFDLLPDTEVKKYLQLLQKTQRTRVLELLSFEPESAGGIMNSDVVTLPEDITVKKSVNLLQRLEAKREHFQSIFITNKNHELVGFINIDDLVLNKPETAIKDIIRECIVAFNVNEDQEVVANQMQHYDLVIAPVVDEKNHFLGIISVDDIFDIIRQEASEDVYKISGITPIEHSYFQTPFWQLIRQRSPWLVALLLLQSISGTILSNYETLLSSHVVLTFFMTMLIGTGGNAGNQSGALVIRGLTTGEISRKNGFLVLLREFWVAIVMATLLAGFGFLRVMWTQNNVVVALTINFALFLIVVTSMLIGSLLPLLLERLNFDPAHSAQPFLSTLMDIIGMLIYCLISSWILKL
jgi:magnesium transporter